MRRIRLTPGVALLRPGLVAFDTPHYSQRQTRRRQLTLLDA
jgi:hypothetical protein